MPVPRITPLLRIQLNQRVNAHDRHTSFNSTLQLLDLAHTRLEHTGLQTILHLAIRQIQTVILVTPRFGCGLVVGLLLLAGLFGAWGRLREAVGGGCLGWGVGVRASGCVFCCCALGEGVAAA